MVTASPLLQAIEVNEPQLPDNTSIPWFVKLVPGLLTVIVVAILLAAVNLYHTSYALGPVQLPPSGTAEGVAPAILPGLLLQLLKTGKLIAPSHSSFAGAEATGSVTQMSKPVPVGDSGAETLVEKTRMK